MMIRYKEIKIFPSLGHINYINYIQTGEFKVNYMAIFLSRCDIARCTSLLYVIKKGFHPYVHFGHFLIQLFIGDDQIPQCVSRSR